MKNAAEQLLATVIELRATLPPERQSDVKQLLSQVDRFLRTAYKEEAIHKRGSALADPLDAALKASILMLEGIDSGNSGPDDELARQFKEQYTRLLGTLRI